MPKKRITKKILFRTMQVLEFIVDASLSVPEVFVGRDVIYKGSRSIFSLDIPDVFAKKSITKNINQLKRYGYLRENKNNSLILTNRAKLKFIEKIAKASKQDNKFRYVSYDIPEKHRIKRDRFRNSIKQMGFVKIQKSLWVIDRDVTELLEMAIEEFGVGDYVVYIVSGSSNVDKMLKAFLKPKNKNCQTKATKQSGYAKESMDFNEFRKKVRW